MTGREHVVLSRVWCILTSDMRMFLRGVSKIAKSDY